MPDPQKTPKQATTSPKRFFRAFNSSPFRLGTQTQARTEKSDSNTLPPFDFESRGSPSLSPSFKIHARSQSHDIASPSVKKSGVTNWTQLIPPLPASPAPSSRLLLSLNVKSSNSNRHTIAVSPEAYVLIPDMLQPLQDPAREQLFVMTNKAYPKRASPFVTAEIPSQKAPGLMPPSHSLQRPAAKPASAPNLLSSFLLGERLSSYAKGRTQVNADSVGQSWTEQTGRPMQRQRSSSRSGKKPQNAYPPKTPPPKLVAMATVPLQHKNLGQNGLTEPSTEETRPETSSNITTQTLQAPVPPPLVAQHLLRAITMVQSQESSTPPHMYRQLPQMPGESQNARVHQGQLMQQSIQNIQNRDKSGTDQEQPYNMRPRRPSGKKRKTCNMCHQVINGQFVRALNNAYHVDCFKCYTCGALCLAKFFPHEVTIDGVTQQVPLCEYDYFKRLSLICHSCDSALRGPYITALGNKYHLEHFKCNACDKVFESDESYYEHENSVYCHFHYSKLFATKCEGCQSLIVKQFVELFKSGKVQQWHPECYMVFKFWNVSVTVDSVGLPEDHINAAIELPSQDLIFSEQKIEQAVMRCWVVLSGFEETLASCISEMLLSACSGKRLKGLSTTGKFVLFVEVLFKALDYVQSMCLEVKPDSASVPEPRKSLIDEVYSIDAFDKFQALRKEPRNISGKLMSYLAILRKSFNIAESGSLSSDLLAVITGCAHYLKLLIRIGLSNALTLNKLRRDSKALDGFLQLVEQYEEINVAEKSGDSKRLISSRLSVPPHSTDACRSCTKSIEKACVLFSNLRWHYKCFGCSKCHRKPSTDIRVESFLCGPNDKILCTDCAMSDNASGMGYTSGFVKVSDLSQLTYLLKIALSRSKIAIKKDGLTTGSIDYLKPDAGMSHIAEEPSETEATYSKTLDEVTSLRQMRESQKLRNSVKKNARRSVILEAPEAVTAKADSTSNDEERRVMNRKGSASSALSFTPLRRDSDHFDFHTNPIKIREDPPHRIPSNSLDRTSDLLKNEKSLTLDDIPRIVAAEQAREQRPNAFKHHNSLYQKKSQQIKSVSNNALPNEPAQTFFASGQESNINHKYFSELTKQEHTILRHIAVEALLSMSSQFSRDDLLTLLQEKKPNTFWDKFKFGGEKGKSSNVFGVELKEVVRKYGVDTSLGVGPSQLRIPMLIEDIILALRQKDMSVEGIFRLNGNIKNLRELTEQINATPLKSPNYSSYSAVQLAALMKKWLRELPNPLLTFNLYDLWISSRRQENPLKAKRVLQLSYCLLPRSHRNLLEVLLYFFSWVASFAEIDEETGSKMDTHNLATVLAPNILLSKAASGENGENQSSDAHFLAIEVVNQLIEIHEDLALIPSDIWEFYNMCQFSISEKTDSIAAKEVQNKINKMSKDHPDFFVKFMKKDSYAEPSHQNTIRSGQTKVHEAGKPSF